MITQFFIDMAVNVLVWIAGLFPNVDTDNLWGGWHDFVMAFDMAKSVGVWIPWDVIFMCVTASLASYGALVVVKMIRAVAAHVPAVGGAGD